MATMIPWQLYVFCAVHVLASLAMYGIVVDPCQLLTGEKPCKAGAETYTARGMAVGFLYVGVYFLFLTYINKDSPPKLKRLAFLAQYSVVALLIGVVFTGSTNLGGAERSLFHFLDMIGMFVLLVIMGSAIVSDSELAGIQSPFAGLRINPKTFVLLVLIATVVKLFLMSDFMDLSSFLADPDSVTKLSHVFWTWLCVQIIEALFALVFALAYGDAKDQEAITIATLLMILISLGSVIPVSDALKEGMMRSGYITIGVTVVVAGIAIAGGRMSSQQSGYEPVSSVV